jgi:hypothetical protein
MQPDQQGTPAMTTDIDNPQGVNGWNIDADPANNPTYPMRDVSADRAKGSDWQQPTLQAETVEVLESIEYTRRPAVFGTTAPPSGLSGAIRRLAFKRSESDWWHWLLLIAADRVNVVEGIVEDLGKGRFPNIPAEQGIRAELKYNRPAFIRKAVVVAGVSAVAITLFARDRSHTRTRRDRIRHRLR